MSRKTVLVTGANGFIGNAVAKAFSRAGWRTYGLIRRPEDAADLALNEIRPVIGSPDDLSFLAQTGAAVFDVVVSNTEDRNDPVGHFERVKAMLQEIARRGNALGVRPLAMFTSGCKDYGMMAEKHGDPRLAPHTEASPMNPPPILAPRTRMGLDLLEATDAPYDATVLRPTCVHGHSSSGYGYLIAHAAQSQGVLRILGDPDAVMHSLHVDDCGDGYVALAEHPERGAVAGEAFNLSNTSYETAREIADALAKSYGLTAECVVLAEGPPMFSVHGLANFWQWVGSDKLRALTNWRERRPTFVDGIEEYRLAYEATVQAKSRPAP